MLNIDLQYKVATPMKLHRITKAGFIKILLPTFESLGNIVVPITIGITSTAALHATLLGGKDNNLKNGWGKIHKYYLKMQQAYALAEN